MIQSFFEKVDFYEKELDLRSQSYIHLKSVRNFLKYYDALSSKHKTIVNEYLESYFIAVSKNTHPDWDESNDLYNIYIVPIAIRYNADMKFKTKKFFEDMLICGAIADAILMFFGITKYIYYIPLGIIVLVAYWYYSHYYFERKGKVFGPRY